MPTLLNVLVLQFLFFIPSALSGKETYILGIHKTNTFLMFVSSENVTRKRYGKGHQSKG